MKGKGKRNSESAEGKSGKKDDTKGEIVKGKEGENSGKELEKKEMSEVRDKSAEMEKGEKNENRQEKQKEEQDKEKEREEKMRKLERENRWLCERMDALESSMKRWKVEARGKQKEMEEEMERIKKELENMKIKEREEEERKGKEKERSEEKEGKAEEDWERKVEENALIIAKGRKWEEGSLEEWIKEKVGESKWKLKIFKENKGKGILIFEKKEVKEKLWRLREDIRKEEKYILDEWLNMEERADRYHLIQGAKEMEEKAGMLGIKLRIKKENKWIEVDGRKYKWNRKEGKLEEIKEEK